MSRAASVLLAATLSAGAARAQAPDCAAEVARAAAATRASVAANRPEMITITATAGQATNMSEMVSVPPDRLRIRVKSAADDLDMVLIGNRLWSGSPGHLTPRTEGVAAQLGSYMRLVRDGDRDAELAALPEPTARNLRCRRADGEDGTALLIFDFDPADREEHVTLTVDAASGLPRRLDEQSAQATLAMTILRDPAAIRVEAPDGTQ